jgi:hypothetical protein
MLTSTRTKGPASPQPITSWFGGLADRLNGLSPNDPAIGNAPFSLVKAIGGAIIAANYGNQFTPCAGIAGFGAFATAPDGTTNTAQVFTEDSSTGEHYIGAALPGCSLGSGGRDTTGPLRFSVFLKYNAAAGRRVCLEVIDGTLAFGYTSIAAVFDLHNGQIGVAATATGHGGGRTGGTAIDARMANFGNGWFRCNIDFAFASIVENVFTARVLLDNGTGTAARSTTYAGSGTGSAFIWKTNLMPIGAYSLSNQTYFTDFTDLSKVDLNNTKNPSFDWFPGGGSWTNFFTEPVPPPSNYSIVGGTALQIIMSGGAPNGVCLSSTAETAPGSYVGKAWKPPFFWEVRQATRYDIATMTGGPHFNVWTISQGALSASGANGTNYQLEPTYLAYPTEIDFCEMQFRQNGLPGGDRNTGPPVMLPHRVGEQLGFAQPGYLARGMMAWYSKQSYRPSFNVSVGGVIYSSNTFTNANDPSPPNASWNTGFVYGSGGGSPNLPGSTFFDVTQQHTWGFLMLPYWGTSDCPGTPYNSTPEGAGLSDASLTGNPRGAQMWTFIDGLLACIGCCMSPFTYPGGGTTAAQLANEGDSFAMWLGGDETTPVQYDFIRVTQ